MKKISFTQDWDVAVKYDHNKINDVLAERFRKRNHGILTDVKVFIDAKDRGGEQYTQWYQFTLGSPSIQFESTPNIPTCSLKAVVTKGKVWAVFEGEKTEDEEELEAKVYTISIRDISFGASTGNAQELNDANSQGIRRK